MLGYQEIIVILVIALLVFGPQKLPEIGRQVGNAMRELRKMSGDVQRALDIDEHLSPYNNRYDDYHTGTESSSFSYSPPTQGETYSQESPYGATAALESSSVADVDAYSAEDTIAAEDVSHDEHHRFAYDSIIDEGEHSGSDTFAAATSSHSDPLHGVVEHENGEPQPVTAASTTAATAAASAAAEHKES